MVERNNTIILNQIKHFLLINANNNTSSTSPLTTALGNEVKWMITTNTVRALIYSVKMQVSQCVCIVKV